jgi:hypothetical protein
VLLVIDATTGQNGLTQARQFTEATEVTGVVLTKLDGSAKGGIVFAIQTELGIPVKLVGLGETIGDLVPSIPTSSWPRSSASTEPPFGNRVVDGLVTSSQRKAFAGNRTHSSKQP